MPYDAQPFRARYRAEISPNYSAWRHAGFVFVFGAFALAFFISRLGDVRPWEWLAVPAGLLLQNWGEYKIHKGLGHEKKRFDEMFYKRHTGDHHSFFAPNQMSFELMHDWRVILFPAWLIVISTTMFLAGWFVVSQWNANVAALFFGSMLLGYMLYETLHSFEHLPDAHPISKLPWVRHMRQLHEVHHSRELMTSANFNIVVPLFDWLYGTLRWNIEDESLASRAGFARLQRDTSVRSAAADAISYIGTATRWPEWHPYDVRIEAPAGSLPEGKRFRYHSARAGNLIWRVTEVIPGRRWQARCEGKLGLVGFLTYDAVQEGSTTRLSRTFEYRFRSPIGRLLDRRFLRPGIEADSIAVLDRLSGTLNAAGFR